jgi:hypothetical protein
MLLSTSGFVYNEYYLYADKQWEVIPSGVKTFELRKPILQNAPVVVTSSGWQVSGPEDPWTYIGGSGKWDKRGYGHFTITPAGVYDTSVKEFSVNPSSSGRLEFNQRTTENLTVEYEAFPSGYYYVDDFNVNPIMREVESGFLQICELGSPTHLSLKSTQSILKGDSFHRANLIATLYDSDLKKIEGEKIIFEMLFYVDPDAGPYEDVGYLIPGLIDGETYKIHPSGFVSETYAYTNKFGQATAQFCTFAKRDGWAVFKAYYAEASGIFDTTELVCYRWRRGPFILDYSMLDGLDYLDDVAWTPSGIPGTMPED